MSPFCIVMMMKPYNQQLQGIWETKAPMITTRFGLTAAVSGTNIYSQIWETKAPMITTRFGLTAAVS